jgi:predicted secreted protein
MGPVSGIVVYVILWWVIFFTLLPVGVKTKAEQGEEVEPGHADSAPVRHYLWRKVLGASLIAAVLWGGYFWLQGSGLVSLRPDFQNERPPVQIETGTTP